jgi:hypothetical protein
MANYRDLKGNRNENGDFIPNFADPEGNLEYIPAKDDLYMEKVGKENLESLEDKEEEIEEEKDFEYWINKANDYILDSGLAASDSKGVEKTVRNLLNSMRENKYFKGKSEKSVTKENKKTLKSILRLAENLFA